MKWSCAVDHPYQAWEIIGELVAGDVPETEASYFYRCPECGQAVDERDLGQVLHHEEAGREPMPIS
jgi:hypothetical protein